MKPLREEHASANPDLAAAARLLAQVGPLAHSRLTQRRVRHQLDSRRQRKTARALRPAIALCVLCALAATASATWGVLQAVTSAETAGTVLEPPVVPRIAPVPPKSLPIPTALPLQQPSVAAPALDPPPPTPLRAGRPFAARPSKPVQPPTASEAALVHRAVKELRGGGDPERARQLLEQYRAANPSGELAEEALVLSIEAAVAAGDPDAKRLARQYLTKYPRGRFLAAARRAQGASGDR